MADPRIGLGYAVEGEVTGPFEVQAARPGHPDQGGTLDCGIVARTASGERIVIGEVWARCPAESPDGVRIDARAVAQALCDRLNVSPTETTTEDTE